MSEDYISSIRAKVGHDRILIPVVGGILSDALGRVLLQRRRDKKTWAIPGGSMELGESSVDTLKREFFEETGIIVEPIRLLNLYTNFDETYPNGDKVQTIAMIYEVKAMGDVTIKDFSNEETLSLRFFSQKEIADITEMSVKHRLMLQEYFTNTFMMGH